MDSAGIGVILGRFRKISMRGGRMVVKGMNASVDRLFQMSGIYAIVERQ
jgi:stage II sporulation protein AA (anti-sigma F factor antagonist)